jgi:AAA+ ATPase superfamily predicted ATPase
MNKNNWEKEFDKKYPEFKGVGAPYPIFARSHNREHFKSFIRQTLKEQRQEIIEEIENYQHGFVRDDGSGEPERAPEWQVIEELLQTLKNKDTKLL